MENKDLQIIINQLRQDNAGDRAHIGFQEFDKESSGENVIKANKEGLQLFAAELLTASMIAPTSQEVQQRFTLNPDLQYSSEIIFKYIALTPESREALTTIKEAASEKSNIFSRGCIVFLIVVAVLVVLGLVTVVRWFS